MDDRRSTKRLFPNCAMQLIFWCDSRVVGRIQNISTEGVAVEYDSQCRPALGKVLTVKIAKDLQSSLVVDDIHCTPIYDISTLVHDQTFRGVNMRLCGLKYAELSRIQHSKLSRLLTSAGLS